MPKYSSIPDIAALIIFVVVFGGCLCLGITEVYKAGYKQGSQETETRIQMEAIKAGIATYGPNQNAKSFFWGKQ